MGITENLKFSPEALADIYLGKITMWNDPRIASSNKGIDLPDTKIQVIHRSDGSGTTYVWSDFLSKVNPEWSIRVGTGTRLKWPAGTGAEGNEGIVAKVQSTANSIGYVELVFAVQHDLSFGAVRNSSGEYVRADLTSLTVAAKRATATAGLESLSSITNPQGKDAYPIAAFTWIVFPRETNDPAKKAALLTLLRWVLTSGQRECSALAYAPLPGEIAAQQLMFLDTLK